MTVLESNAKPPGNPSVDQSDRWLEVFSLLAHDLESPLASVKYLLRTMDKGKFDLTNERHQKLVYASRIAVERAESILYDILTVAKAGDAGIPVRMETVLLKPIIEDSVSLAVGSAEGNSISIELSEDISELSVMADPSLLRRTFDNLLYNGIRHTPTKGKIKVYTEQGEKCIFIHIKDSGTGLGDVDASQIFEKFGQLEMRASGKHRGVGLGLYFCKLAATGMGGTILADNHPDGGAVFSVKLRIAEG